MNHLKYILPLILVLLLVGCSSSDEIIAVSTSDNLDSKKLLIYLGENVGLEDKSDISKLQSSNLIYKHGELIDSKFHVKEKENDFLFIYDSLYYANVRIFKTDLSKKYLYNFHLEKLNEQFQIVVREDNVYPDESRIISFEKIEESEEWKELKNIKRRVTNSVVIDSHKIDSYEIDIADQIKLATHFIYEKNDTNALVEDKVDQFSEYGSHFYIDSKRISVDSIFSELCCLYDYNLDIAMASKKKDIIRFILYNECSACSDIQGFTLYFNESDFLKLEE